jgi:hypothetical protein
MTRAPLLVVDREHRVLHRCDCRALLEATTHLEPYVGLEHAIEDGRLSLCPCVAIVVMRSTAEYLGQASVALGTPGLKRLCDNLYRVIKALDQAQLRRAHELATPSAAKQTPQ